ncbi:type VI secretion system ImpA family N-terminal domain-containing protein [Paracoccus caeni]|uniref:Type VI secretion system ImpA family N-terminal domain-containing protein n=1 Tax=Paracoccus caeni TaxID=657651 RepID=A0A934VZL5_9RHOB|nr:type VI secretion system ImpA family N-terminal domain-containing protein [Paracoccus caeni]MBK4214949.1 type VI secretion system ImpA family N-terminal domain-containing protein [Paracoccus caeni]
MTRDELLKPISGDQPTGPDLEQTDDAEFIDYYFEAESRLPERYFVPGSLEDGREDRLFDPRSVDLRREQAAINGLLKKSRDLRLLSLLARFQILAGKLPDFVDSIEAMADMLSTWPAEVHPSLDGGTAERRAAIEALNSQTAVVAPLSHLPLLPNADLSLRRHLVASGNAAPRLSEEGVAGSDQSEPLRSDANQRHVRAAHELLTRAAEALFRLQNLAASQGGGSFNADLGAVRGAIADIQGMIATSRSELAPWSEAQSSTPAVSAAGTLEMPPHDEVNESVQIASPAPQTRATEVRGVPDRATAAASLDAALNWLARAEPSSPALILVAQARQLVGAPLVEAIQVLMPDRANAAILSIGQGSGFALPMDKLRELTKVSLENVGDAGNSAMQPAPILRRGDLVAQLLGVEGYFTAQEPASPIPLLLAKARTMLDKRFDAIMAELLVPPAAGS